MTLFKSTIIEIEKYTRQRHPGERLSVIMAHSPHWYLAAHRAFLHLRTQQPYTDYLESIAPSAVKDARQLHAPDLLAYETYLLKLRERYPTKHGPREYMMDLLKKKKLGKE